MPHTKTVFDWMNKNIADILPTDDIKTYLYVGWCRVTKDWWAREFVQKIGAEKIGLLEVFDGNFELFKKNDLSRTVEATKGNIKDFAKLYTKGQWDLVYWDHGPEHAESLDMLKEVTEILKEHTKVILYACPWGSCPQSELYGNKFEKHEVTIYEEDFENLGMTVKTFGNKNTGAAGELVAWWIKKG